MKVLSIQSSSTKSGSSTRVLSEAAVEAIRHKTKGSFSLKVRELGDGIAPINEAYLTGRGKQNEDRSTAEKEANALGDRLIEELIEADIILIGAPMYNFSVPSNLKIWFDYVAQAGKTFSYTENGPKGLLEDKKAIVLTSMGGDWEGKEHDFLTSYIPHFLNFIGISDQHSINAKKQAFPDKEIYLSEAKENLEKAVSELITN